MKYFIIASLLLVIWGCSTKTDTVPTNHVPVSQALYDTIIHMDSILFNAFNGRDFTTLQTLFTSDLEFYHDKAGVSGYETNIENFKSNFAKYPSLKRMLVTGSTEVFPIKNYGAVQTGRHKFCNKVNGKEECATFKFTHLWKNDNGTWKISRVISYDH